NALMAVDKDLQPKLKLRQLVRRVDEVRLDDYVLAELQLGLQVLIDSHQGIVDILAPVLTLGDRHGGAALQSRERFRISSVPPAPSTRRRPGRGHPRLAGSRLLAGSWGLLGGHDAASEQCCGSGQFE